MAGMKGAPIYGGLLPKKLSDAQVDAIRYRFPGVKHTEVARMFGVDPSLVRRIRAGKARVRRFKDAKLVVKYQAPPIELVERQDLDVWFARRGAALLRGYATAVEKWQKEGRFEEPKPEEWQVDDEYGRDGFATNTRTAAERLAARASKYLQEQGARPCKRPKPDESGEKQRAGEPDLQDLLYDSKKRFG